MINYKKLMEHNPSIYETITNSKGQTINLAEHPIHGDMSDVIVICHELQLAEHSGFFDTEDMTSDHGEYEPSFIDGSLYIGDFKT